MKEDKAILKVYTGEDTEVTVSVDDRNCPISEVKDKAFLSCKTVEKLVLGDFVEVIGDWAFAHMQNLRTLVLPGHEILFGKKVFLDCEKLREIQIRDDESGNPGTPFFMASAVRILKKEELCRPEMAGRSAFHREWMKEYDNALLGFIQEKDTEGFEPVFIGWFHVEDTDEQIPRYLKKKREEKAELIFQRLLYPMFLSEEDKAVLEQYLRDHMPEGSRAKEHTVVFDMLCDASMEYGKDIAYMKILERAGCLTKETVSRLLENMEEAAAEITAFLLKKQAELTKGNDYFSEFEW
ncbi:MAG: leucine-rich repeat protein [Suilimivivens sp.]